MQIAESNASAARLSQLRVPKASDVLSRELRERILDGTYLPGAGLPTERELILQTGMGRTTVREALRILEVQGLVTMRTGRAGGAFVCRPGEEVMVEAVDLLVRNPTFPLIALLETREAIEPHSARLAALHRDADDLAVLEDLTLRVANDFLDLEDFLDAHIEWHLAVARASHNELLAGVLIGLSRAIRARAGDPALLEASVRESAVKAHDAVMQAIRASDGDAAFRRMARHVHAHTAAVQDRAAH